MGRLTALALLLVAAGCDAPGESQTFAVTAFPKTRERTGVSFFRFERHHDGRYLAVALDGAGKELGRLSAGTQAMRWPNGGAHYARPTDLTLRWGGDALHVDYLPERKLDQLFVVHRQKTVELFGNPAYPGRCKVGNLADGFTSSETAALAAWLELVPDLSANLGTVNRRWSDQVALLNRASNYTTALCCLSGDERCCSLPPFELDWTPLPVAP